MSPTLPASRTHNRRSSLVKHAKSLAFHSLQLTGRNEEIKKLHDIYHAHFDDDGCPPKVVLISGYSGVGKSALMETLKDVVVSNSSGGYFCMGKQEQLSKQPLQAVSEAMADLTAKIVESEEHMKRIDEAILASSNNASRVLSPQLAALLLENSPELYPIFRSMGQQLEYETGRLMMSDQEHEIRNKVQLAYRKLLGMICSKETPIVLAIDDLQWSDVATLDLLVSLAKDSDS